MDCSSCPSWRDTERIGPAAGQGQGACWRKPHRQQTGRGAASPSWFSVCCVICFFFLPGVLSFVLAKRLIVFFCSVFASLLYFSILITGQFKGMCSESESFNFAFLRSDRSTQSHWELTTLAHQPGSAPWGGGDELHLLQMQHLPM